jgi:hypothetical protein
MSITPPVLYGNSAYPPKYIRQQRNYIEHGEQILGGREALAQHAAYEFAFGLWNGLQHTNLDLGITLNKLITSMSYQAEDGRKVQIKPLHTTPDEHPDVFNQNQGLYKHYEQRSDFVLVDLSRAALKHGHQLKDKQNKKITSAQTHEEIKALLMRALGANRKRGQQRNRKANWGAQVSPIEFQEILGITEVC